VLGQAGVLVGDYFDSHSEHNMWRVGVRLTFPAWRAQLAAGATASDDFAERFMEVGGEPQFFFWDTRWEFGYARLNLGWRPTADLDLGVSAIGRGMQYEARGGEPMAGEVGYESTSLSTSVQASYALSHRFSVGGHAIVEYQRREESGGESRARTMPRFGLFTGFWF
jgi:hypothetical protein